MQGGRIRQVLRTDETERGLASAVNRLDDVLARLRDRIREGGRITAAEMEGVA
jgi:hypothetical protein